MKKNTFLTFCLVLACLYTLSMSATAGLPRLNFSSPEFSQFSSVTTQIKPIPFESVDVCKVRHEQMLFSAESLKGAEWEDALKKEIARVEKIDERHLNFFNDFQTPFRSEQEILDNVYCFPFLSSQQMQNHPDRTSLMVAYQQLSQSVHEKLSILIYYRDGFENSSPSRLWVYFYHRETGDIYKVKANQSLEHFGIF